MLNHVTIMGRITRDIELKRTNNGDAVVSFSIANESDFKGNDGSRKTQFIDIVAWKNTAEFVKKYFSKGRMAIVEGRLQARSWQDNNGAKRVNYEVIATSIYFGDSAKPETNADQFVEVEEEDSRLPF